jgi:hypothetical protein
MAEPVSSSGGIALAAGAITFASTIFGVQYDTLLAGFFGGLVALSYLPPMSYARVAGSVAGSALLAGYFAPVAAVASVNYFPWLHDLGDFLRVACAAAIGLGAQAAIPAAFAWLRHRGEQP